VAFLLPHAIVLSLILVSFRAHAVSRARQVFRAQRRLRPTLLLQRNVRLMLARRAAARLRGAAAAFEQHVREERQEAALVLVLAWRGALALRRVRLVRWRTRGLPLLRRAALVCYRPCPRPAGPPPTLVSPASASVHGC